MQFFDMKWQQLVTLAVSTMNTFSNSTTVKMFFPKRITNTTVSYYIYTYRNQTGSGSSSTLSTGAIIGIVIAVIVVICCLALCGCCASGHWETRQVWVAH